MSLNHAAGKEIIFAGCVDVAGVGPTLRARCNGAMLIDMANPVFTRNPEILDGEAVFPGTRVPVKTLTDYLEAGETIDAFLADFPSVDRGQAVTFLERALERLTASAI